MVMVKLVENDHIIIEDEQLSTDYYYAFKEQKQGMVNFLLFIFMKWLMFHTSQVSEDFMVQIYQFQFFDFSYTYCAWCSFAC